MNQVTGGVIDDEQRSSLEQTVTFYLVRVQNKNMTCRIKC